MVDVANAQTVASTAAPAAASSPLAMIVSFAPFIIIMILFYFLMIYPQNKERKKKEEEIRNIKRGDRVLTRGGHYGIVHDIKDHVLTLKVSENTKVEVHKDYIDSIEKLQ